MGFAEITQLADKIQAVVVAVGLWSSEKPIRPSGWSMASSMLMWEAWVVELQLQHVGPHAQG